ncbi:MAG: hypothetical protein QW599_05620 [Nitrososphaerota archaeon]
MNDYGTVRSWITSLKACGKAFEGSTTERRYVFWLSLFCNHVGMNPDELFLSFSEKIRFGGFQGMQEVRTALNDFVVHLQDKGYSRNSIAQAVAAVKSFFSHNGLPIKYAVPREEPAEPRLPTPEEIATLYSLVDRVCPMNAMYVKAFILIAKDSGLSVDTVLRLEWEKPQSTGAERPFPSIAEQIETGAVPVHVRVSRKKTGVKHDSFLGEEAVSALKILYEESGARGRLIPLRDDYIRHRLRRACRVGKIPPISPQLLRKFFITRMKLAPRLVGKNLDEKAKHLVHYLHGWDVIVEYMAEHTRSRVERAYFIPPWEILAELYTLHYDAIRIFRRG